MKKDANKMGSDKMTSTDKIFILWGGLSNRIAMAILESFEILLIFSNFLKP